MPSLESINILLSEAAKRSDHAASEIREAQFQPTRRHIEWIGRALDCILEVQFKIYEVKPELKPEHLKYQDSDKETLKRNERNDSMPMEGADVAYVQEYKKMIREYARMAANFPDMIGQLRTALKTSAAMMMSNRPEAISEIRGLAKEVDAFLHACETGEVDPRSLLEHLDKEA